MNELMMPKGISSQKRNELNVICIRLGKELSFAKVFAFSSETVASAAPSTENKIRLTVQRDQDCAGIYQRFSAASYKI